MVVGSKLNHMYFPLHDAIIYNSTDLDKVPKYHLVSSGQTDALDDCDNSLISGTYCSLLETALLKAHFKIVSALSLIHGHALSGEAGERLLLLGTCLSEYGFHHIVTCKKE